jgi:antibiotic biosynthesis monooxygenase (ABM) superfamily enzyme
VTRNVDPSMSVALSGSFDTEQLPRIAPEPVTVTVARTIRPGFEAQYLQWADDVVATLRTVHGCLGAGVLLPGPDGGDHQIVFRFIDGIKLREWERSKPRADLMARAETFVLAERITRTVGVESFFDLPERAEPKRPLAARIFTDVAWVYPVAIASSILVAPLLAGLPLWLRVVLSSLIITVVMRLAVGPMRHRLRRRRSL